MPKNNNILMTMTIINIAAATTSSNVTPLFSTQYVPGTMLGILHVPFHFILTITLRGEFSIPLAT